MAHIATSDIHQSEAYISTVALFFMSASVPRKTLPSSACNMEGPMGRVIE